LPGPLNKHIDEILHVHDLTVRYGSVTALNEVNISVLKGEIHALVGEHGAGKSTLVKSISGAVTPASGKIIFANKAFDAMTPDQAISLGIGTVYQERRYDMKLTAAEIIFRGKKHNTVFLPQKKKLKELIYTVLDQVGLGDVDPSVRMFELREEQRQMVEIASVLFNRPSLLILDELGSRYTTANLDKIYSILFQQRLENVGIVYISHRMDEIFELADTVSVLRNGRLVGTEKVSGLNKMKLLQMTYPFVLTGDSHAGFVTEAQHLMQFDSALLNQVPIGIAMLDSEFRTITLNHAISKHTLFRHRDCIGKTIFELFDFLKDSRETIVQDIMSGNRVTLNQLSYMVRGKSFTVDFKISPIVDTDQKLLGCMVIMEDITGSLMIEKQLLRSEQMSIIGQMTTGVAHEINNPLGIILNYLELLRLNGQENDSLDMIDKIERETVRIKKLVSSLLNVSSKEKSKYRGLVVNDVIRETRELFSPRMTQKKIGFRFTDSHENLVIHGNEDELRQVFINLLMNSIDAVTPGGTISVKLFRDSTNRAVIVFRDDGEGFGFEVQKKLFEPFFTTKSNKNRSGLGLFIVKRIIEEHGGIISAESKPGHGASFTLSLPILSTVLHV